MRTYQFVPMMFVALGLLAWAASPSLLVAAEHEEAHAEESHEEAGHGEDSHEAGAHGEDTHSGDPNPLAVDLDLAIWTGVVFVVLFLVLSKFAWPAISAALDERENRIENNIAEASAKHEEAKQLLVQHEAKLAGAADEVRALLEEARRDAEHTKTQILDEAKKLSDQERDRAIRDVERATDAAMRNLAETSANLAVDLAGKVVQQNISAEQQADLVRDALNRLAASSPSEN